VLSAVTACAERAARSLDEATIRSLWTLRLMRDTLSDSRRDAAYRGSLVSHIGAMQPVVKILARVVEGDTRSFARGVAAAFGIG
jgi:hypothetical protein